MSTATANLTKNCKPLVLFLGCTAGRNRVVASFNSDLEVSKAVKDDLEGKRKLPNGVMKYSLGTGHIFALLLMPRELADAGVAFVLVARNGRMAADGSMFDKCKGYQLLEDVRSMFLKFTRFFATSRVQWSSSGQDANPACDNIAAWRQQPCSFKEMATLSSVPGPPMFRQSLLEVSGTLAVSPMLEEELRSMAEEVCGESQSAGCPGPHPGANLTFKTCIEEEPSPPKESEHEGDPWNDEEHDDEVLEDEEEPWEDMMLRLGLDVRAMKRVPPRSMRVVAENVHPKTPAEHCPSGSVGNSSKFLTSICDVHKAQEGSLVMDSRASEGGANGDRLPSDENKLTEVQQTVDSCTWSSGDNSHIYEMVKPKKRTKPRLRMLMTGQTISSGSL